jgi:hypothetical protein
MYDITLATRLRAAGLTVVEVAGWQSRGAAGFDPRGSVDHHTAGPRSGNAPSLATVIYGRPDLPGPLCHVLVARDNTCYVIAAGRANHAGSGSWRGLSGNSSVYGVERENVGTSAEPWRSDQTSTAATVHAALIRGRATHEMVCGHKEWTPRKPDPHTLNMHNFRAMVAQRLGSTPAPTPPKIEGDPMAYLMVQHHTGDVWLYADGGTSLERTLVSGTSNPRPGHVEALKGMGVPLEGMTNAIQSQVKLDVTRAI